MQSAETTRTSPSYITATTMLVAIVILLGAIFTQSTSAQTPDAPQSPAVTITPTSTPTLTECPPLWIVPVSQNVGDGENILKDVTAVSPNDIWAVGYYDLGGGVYRTMAQHWDGSQWSLVTTPNPGYSNFLSGVSAISANDIWAVGYYNLSPTTGGYHLLTLHWDGTQWNEIPNPDPGFNYTNLLYAVDAVATNDVWTVGFYRHTSPLQLVMHWDGSQWTVNNSLQTPIASLSAVDARTATDVWAAGGINSDPIFEHYDGTGWSLVPEPAIANPAYLNGIVSVAANDAWAVGAEVIGGVNHSLAERWDGTSWTRVQVPDVGRLYGIDAVSPTDIWAVGEGYFIHWNGTLWLSKFNPVVSQLFGIDVIAYDNIYAVGTQNVGGVNRTLIEHYAQLCGTPTPTPQNTGTPTITPQPTNTPPPTSTFTSSPIPTNTPQTSPTATHSGTGTPESTSTSTLTSTSTRTPTPTLPTGTTTPLATNTPNSSTATPSATTPIQPTSTATPTEPSFTATAVLTTTPTSTATVCAITFTDVEPGSTFYSYIHTLACLGIVQGYPDGTYRPADSVTRGQASKIISNSASWDDTIPPNRQTFNDVPPNSTFWLYIERMYIHEAIQGYPCGDPAEPCPGTYFRPANTITRGQIAKIASISAGYTDTIPPQQQTFSDVPPNSSFWLYIERVALHNVINGYDDGTYRPQNTVTRGQLAKIAVNTFFPGERPTNTLR